MNFNDYRHYDTEDFLVDEVFRELVEGRPVDGMTFDKLKEMIPEKKEEIYIAAEILRRLSTEKKEIPKKRKDEILEMILRKKKMRPVYSVFKYAAIILFVVGIGIIVQFLVHVKPGIENYVSSADSIPRKTELVLANGERIEIESQQSEIEYSPNGATISLNDTSTIVQPRTPEKISYNEMIVPYGRRSGIRLSDGSVVRLNSGSRLVYPSAFEGKNREVYLEGEAFFEISKNKNIPFVVRTENFQVKVLGTQFLVQSLPAEEQYNTILVEGKVSLKKSNRMFSKEYELAPNQKAALSADGNADFNITEIKDAENYLAWLKGYLIFENENIISLTKKISRYYNVEIEVESGKVSTMFSGKLDLKEDLDQIFGNLSTIYNLKYKKEGEIYIIYE